jgi:O-acetyl-ADP-ribose deacetylase (regulator of RNase III)
MKEYKLIKGDVTKPIGEGDKIIIHCCNNCVPGVMGAGVALAIRKKWPIVYDYYREWSLEKSCLFNSNKYVLGNVGFVKVEDNIAVGNMLGQDGIGFTFTNGIPPIRYDAIDRALFKVAEVAKSDKASVHIPFLMGSALAGGDWSEIEKLIVKNLCANDIDVTIYDFN